MTDRHKGARKTLRASESEFAVQEQAAELAGISWNRWATDTLNMYAAVAVGSHPALKHTKVPTE